MIKQKKAGSIAILLLVIMTLVLCGVALFVFIIPNKVEKKIYDARIIEDVYSEEREADFYFNRGVNPEYFLKDFKVYIPDRKSYYIPQTYVDRAGDFLDIKRGNDRITGVYRISLNKYMEKPLLGLE